MDLPAHIFHMTTAETVREVRSALNSGAGDWFFEPSDGLSGPGIYGLATAPDCEDPDELRYQCFADARPEHPMDGALMLDATLAWEEWEHVEGMWPQMYWCFETPHPLDDHIVATAIRTGNVWTWEEHY